ncbi:tape measure protein [Candidatus Poriferisodalis sp.]|uniref:tape measure protein n=1 Tax=Candidatus Poriferisodalis sp. TaxID=3101277 RepID=UPI003B02598D
MVDIGTLRARFTSDVTDFNRNMASAETTLGRVAARATLVGTAVGLIGREYIQLADANVRLENRLRVVTETEAQQLAVRQELVDISQRWRTDVADLAEVYGRLRFSIEDIDDGRVLRLTESLLRAGIAGGSSVRELNAGLVQLTQGFASNRFQGDELRSVLESLPGITRVLVTGFRRLSEEARIDFEVNGIGDIRNAAAEGQLTRDVLVDAFEAAEDVSADLGEELRFGVGQSFQLIKTEAIEWVDTMERGLGPSAGLAGSLEAAAGFSATIRDNVNEFIDSLNVEGEFEDQGSFFGAFGSIFRDRIPGAQFRQPTVFDVDNRQPLEGLAPLPDVEVELVDFDFERAVETFLEQQKQAVRDAAAAEQIRAEALNRVNEQTLAAIEAERELAAARGEIRDETLNRVNEQRLERIREEREAAAELAEEQEAIRNETLNRINQQRLDEINEAEQALLDQQLGRYRLLGSTIEDVFDAAIRDTLEWEDVFLAALSNLLQYGAGNLSQGLGFFGGSRQFGGAINFSGDYIVGERGAERVFLPSGAHVEPGLGGVTISPTFVFEGGNAEENYALFSDRAIPQLNRVIDARIARMQNRGNV